MRRALSELSWQDACWHAAYDSIGLNRATSDYGHSMRRGRSTGPYTIVRRREKSQVRAVRSGNIDRHIGGSMEASDLGQELEHLRSQIFQVAGIASN